jgi:hypothetical protein
MMNDLGGKHPERPSKGGREKKKNNKNKAEMKRPSTSFASVVFFSLSLSLFLGNISSHPVGFTTSESVGR